MRQTPGADGLAGPRDGWYGFAAHRSRLGDPGRSLEYLQKLPVDSLKIDRSFVGRGLEKADDVSIVKSVIDLGHNLGLKVIAEGGEDRRTLERLIALGCDAAQGFLLARPMDDGELMEWLASSPWSPEHSKASPFPA